MRLRKMRPKDLSTIIAITRENMTPILRASWNQDWDVEPFLHGVVHPASETVVLLDGRRIIGYVTHLRQRNDTLFVWSMMVAGDKQKKGYGRVLMEVVEDVAQQCSCWGIELNVQSANRDALGFYRHMGFRTIKAIDVDGGHPDLRLRKRLPPVRDTDGPTQRVVANKRQQGGTGAKRTFVTESACGTEAKRGSGTNGPRTKRVNGHLNEPQVSVGSPRRWVHGG